MKKLLKSGLSIFLAITFVFSSVLAGLNVVEENDFLFIEAKASGNESCSHPETEVLNACEARCFSEGYSGDTYCTDCAKLLDEGEVIPKLKHVFVGDVCQLCQIPLWQYGMYSGVGVIEQYNGYESALVVPRFFEDSKIEIGIGAFYCCKTLTSVSLPNNVVKIRHHAFESCTSLESIVIPQSMESIAFMAFLNCTALASITIPGSVKSIEEKALGYRYDEKGNIVKLDSFTIYGVKKSAAHTYAIENDFTFIAVETEEAPQLICSTPNLKSIENTQYGVLIKWGKVKGADKYRVYRKTSKTDWEYIGYTTNTYYTDKKAKSGKKYYYAVKARNEAGNSSLSNSLSKYYLDDPTLNTPSSTSKGVGLRWSKVTGAKGYMVYRRTTNGSYKLLATEKGVSNVTFRDTTAKKGTKYYYKVKAYYSKTYSAYSNTKSITDKY